MSELGDLSERFRLAPLPDTTHDEESPEWTHERDRKHVCPRCWYIGPALQCACVTELRRQLAEKS